MTVHTLPDWWNPDQALSLVPSSLTNGFELASQPTGPNQLPVYTLKVEHSDFQPTGDHWFITTAIRLGLNARMTVRREVTTKDIVLLFTPHGDPSWYRRLEQVVTVPDAAPWPALNVVWGYELSDALLEHVCRVLGAYGTMTDTFRPSLEVKP